MPNSCYYTQVEAVVSPTLTIYRDDLLVKDKEALNNFHGEFVHGSRDTGTNLLMFDDDGHTLTSEEREIVDSFLFKSNDRFIIGRKGFITQVDVKAARVFYERNLHRSSALNF